MPTYLGGTFYLLLDISEGNFFPRWGGGGVCTCTQCTPPPMRTRLQEWKWWRQHKRFRRGRKGDEGEVVEEEEESISNPLHTTSLHDMEVENKCLADFAWLKNFQCSKCRMTDDQMVKPKILSISTQFKPKLWEFQHLPFQYIISGLYNTRTVSCLKSSYYGYLLFLETSIHRCA